MSPPHHKPALFELSTSLSTANAHKLRQSAPAAQFATVNFLLRVSAPAAQFVTAKHIDLRV